MDVGTFVVTRWWAGLIAFATLAAILVLAHVLIVVTEPAEKLDMSLTRRRRRGAKALVMGADGRASTSKVQVLLWTLAVLYAFVFLLIWGRSIGCDGNERDGPTCRQAASNRSSFARLVEEPMDTEYLALLGLPVAAAVAAKTLTQSKVVSGELTKTSVDETDKKVGGVGKGLAEVISGDNGETDLIDFQYFAFNLVALSYFALEFLGSPSEGLPELPPTLIALSGVAVAAYTSKKAIQKDAAPVIAAVIPRRLGLVAGSTFTVIGSGFGTAGGDDPDTNKARLLIAGLPVTVLPSSAWTDSTIEVALDDATADALRDLGVNNAEVTVMVARGVVSNEFRIELVSAPATRQRR